MSLLAVAHGGYSGSDRQMFSTQRTDGWSSMVFGEMHGSEFSGVPCSLDSKAVINVDDDEELADALADEAVADEQLEDEVDRTNREAAAIDLNPSEPVEQYGERADFWNEYVTVSNSKACQPPATCLNVEEIGRVFDEVFAYLIRQGKHLLDDFVSLSFKETKEKVADHRAHLLPTGNSFALRSSTNFPKYRQRKNTWNGHAEVVDQNTKELVTRG